jgi:hypothetical protein
MRDAFRRLCKRDTMPLVESEFMECHSPDHAAKLAEQPLKLPTELRQKDRRDLDLAVLEMLGVPEAEREKLCDELYRETALHFRQIRIVEIQKQKQRGATDNRGFGIDELAIDLWDGLAADDKVPLSDWLSSQMRTGTTISIPEGHPRLMDATDMLDATAVFFSHSKKSQRTDNKLTLPTRAHAELVNRLASVGMHGKILLSNEANEIHELDIALAAWLQARKERATQLARSRVGDADKSEELADLLFSWMVHGRSAGV